MELVRDDSSGEESGSSAGDSWNGVWHLGWENPLEEEMATHSSIFPWKIPQTEGPDGLQCSQVWLSMHALL